MSQAASGRKRAASSGSAWGKRASSRTPGAMPSWAERLAVPTPRTIAWVASENAVAPPTKRIASGPAFSCTQRERPPGGGRDRERAPGDEAGDAGERVEGKHETVPEENVADVGERGRVGHAGH